MTTKKSSFKKKRITRLERVAYHEAGHAVVAFRLRRRFQHVTIEPETDSLGHVLFTRFNKGFQPDAQSSPAIDAKIDQCVMTALAGPIAEKQLTGRWNGIGAQQDIEMANNMACWRNGSEKQANAYIKWLTICVEEMLDRKRDRAAVQALANSLLENTTLRSNEACEIIRIAMQSS